MFDSKVSLGITPDYEYTGIGLRVGDTEMDKLGESAGLKKGDIILQMGQPKFNIYKITRQS